MRLIGYVDDDQIMVGRIEGETVAPIASRETFWNDIEAALAMGPGKPKRLAGLRRKPATPSSGKVVCIGLNYRAHAEEAKHPIPEKPVVFSRWAETLICDGDPSPAMADAYDWEAELGVVIGRRGLQIDEANAFDHVLGYCTFNDLSCRRLQVETPQWTLGKNSDRSGPMGPVVTADETGDPAKGWRVTTHVNGERMQDGNTADFIFPVPQILAWVSRAMTLNPGDLIITGTPAGVGAARTPPRFLNPGDVVRVEVGGLGAVTTPIVAAGAAGG